MFLHGTGLPTPTQEVEVIEYEVEHGLLLEKRGRRGRDGRETSLSVQEALRSLTRSGALR